MDVCMRVPEGVQIRLLLKGLTLLTHNAPQGQYWSWDVALRPGFLGTPPFFADTLAALGRRTRQAFLGPWAMGWQIRYKNKA